MIVETRKLGKYYRNLAAVSGLDLSIPDGRISAFLGPNGSGKTTTIKMVLGLVRPSDGEAFVFNESVRNGSALAEARRRMGYVAEDKRLYGHMTVEQVLDFTRPFYPRWSRDRERDLMARFALPSRRAIKALSKGMRTKLAFLLAVARRPEFLILDEPGEGLDAVAMEEMLELVVEAAAEGATVLFSTHQIADIERIADHVFIMSDGVLVFEGSLERLRESCRRVNLVFPRSAPVGDMQLEGVRRSWVDGQRLSLLIDGNLEAIMAKAHGLGAMSVDVQGISLREWFVESVAAREV